MADQNSTAENLLNLIAFATSGFESNQNQNLLRQ